MNIPVSNKQSIKSTTTIYEIMKSIYAAREENEQHKEYFYAIGLDAKNRILYVDLLAIGTVNLVSPPLREILRLALIKNATGVILIHNHPSGDTTPSPEDRTYTRKAKEALLHCEIKFLDHVIIGEGYYSFQENSD